MTEPADPNQLFMRLVRSIVAADAEAVRELLLASPQLARFKAAAAAMRQTAGQYYFKEIEHYLYGGDTALHMAAAAYREAVAAQLFEYGADVRARNRRGAEPLHYAADGHPDSAGWNPRAQAATIGCLLRAGADPNCVDRSGVAPLHRAVRTRCAAAVRALLEGGADPRQPNESGTTPMSLAQLNTGRGGSGTPAARQQQQEIVQTLHEYGAV